MYKAVVALVMLAAMGALAQSSCAVGCAYPPHHWRKHHDHPAWQALSGKELCSGTARDALDGVLPAQVDDAGHEAASEVVAAQLNLAMFQCPTAAPASLLVVGAALQRGCVGVVVPQEAVDDLAAWNAGKREDGPCHCSDLECARVVAPQKVIDKETAAIEELSSADVGFLVWAIVMTVVSAILAVVVLVLLCRIDWGSWRDMPATEYAMMATPPASGVRL